MALPAANAVDNGMVLVLITVTVLPIAAVAFARSGPAWRRLGRGPLAIEPQPPAGPGAARPGAARAIQEAEVRQMLEAKSFRRRRRGEAPLDVEAETARLLEGGAERFPAPSARSFSQGAIDLRAEARLGDPSPFGGSVAKGEAEELRTEVRQLVVRRNERRLRKGLDPLDVEAETERQLRDLVRSC